MTHIGYVYVYHIVNSTGVVIDSHKIAHLFVSDTQKKYSRFQFVVTLGTVLEVNPESWTQLKGSNEKRI